MCIELSSDIITYIVLGHCQFRGYISIYGFIEMGKGNIYSRILIIAFSTDEVMMRLSISDITYICIFFFTLF